MKEMNLLKKVPYFLVFLLVFTVFFLPHQDITYAKSKEASLNPNRILNVAHRGASGHAPEHTLPGYKLGEEMKGDYIEIDLQMTKDGTLIAMHDEKVDRTTNGTGSVKDFTLDEIKQLDAGSWFNEKYPDKAKPEYEGLTVPTLEEIIIKFGTESSYYIETKSPDVYPGMEEELLRLLNKYKLLEPNAASNEVLIQSFSPESLSIVNALNPNVPLIQLISYSKPATITDEELNEISEYAIGIGASHTKIDQDYVKKVRDHNLLIHPYTVNTKEDMIKVLDWGVTGMFTNYPDILNEVLKNRFATTEIKESVEQFKSDGEFANDRAAHALTMHLTAVSQYEEKGSTEKVVKHMEGFRLLLDQQLKDELISREVYDSLKDDANNLINQWQ